MRRVVFPVVLGLLVVTATVALTEVASRVVRRSVCVGAGTYMAYASPHFGWTHIPGITYLDQRCIGREFEFRQQVRINSKGLRDSEHPYERVPGRPRVLVLGDSVVEAAQVGPDEPWTEVLERGLGDAGLPAEVINAGHAGWSQHHQVAWYEHEGRRYGADLVVSQFNIQNDVAEIAAPIHARLYAGSGMPPLPPMSVDERGHLAIDTTPWREFAEQKEREASASSMRWHSLRENLYLLRWLTRHFERSAAAPVEHDVATHEASPTGPFGIFAAVPDAEWEAGWQLVEAGYRRLRDAVEADGARLLVVVMPTREVIYPEFWKVLAMAMPELGRGEWDLEGPGRRLRAFLEREGIEHVDLTPAMKEAFAATGRHGFFDVDPHPTAEGHRTIAGALLPAVRERLRDIAPRVDGPRERLRDIAPRIEDPRADVREAAPRVDGPRGDVREGARSIEDPR